VKNNRNNCFLFINNKKKDLCEYYNFEKNNEEILIVKLIEIKTITDMSFMFCKCETLSFVPNMWNWNTDEVIDILVGYGLSLSAAQYMCIKCFDRQDLFVIDEVTDKAIANINDWEEYEDARDFADWVLIDERVEISAYLNEIIRWDMDNPPKPGDEMLWE
jgi:hypothetical protein